MQGVALVTLTGWPTSCHSQGFGHRHSEKAVRVRVGALVAWSNYLGRRCSPGKGDQALPLQLWPQIGVAATDTPSLVGLLAADGLDIVTGAAGTLPGVGGTSQKRCACHPGNKGGVRRSVSFRNLD